MTGLQSEGGKLLFRSDVTGQLLWSRRIQVLMTFLKFVVISLQLWGKYVMIKSVNKSVGDIFVCLLGTAALLGKILDAESKELSI